MRGQELQARAQAHTPGYAGTAALAAVAAYGILWIHLRTANPIESSFAMVAASSLSGPPPTLASEPPEHLDHLTEDA